MKTLQYVIFEAWNSGMPNHTESDDDYEKLLFKMPLNENILCKYLYSEAAERFFELLVDIDIWFNCNYVKKNTVSKLPMLFKWTDWNVQFWNT